MNSTPTIEQVLNDTRKFEYRRAKIVATIGPASGSKEIISKLIEAGTNVFRLNFSHGTHAEHLEVLQTIREVASELNVFVAILQDLSGPKIRTTKMPGGSVSLKDSGFISLKFSSTKEESSADKIFIESVNPSEIVRPGHKVLLSDGALVFEATEVTVEQVRCKVMKGGELRSNAGVCFPDSKLDLPAVTDKDLKDLDWGIKHGVDYAALSFVSSAQDIVALKKHIQDGGGHAKVIAKIERRAAVENIDSILDVAHGIMVARGDLGLELSLEKLPILQKLLIEKASHKGIPVIVATEMLQSMISSVRPTRAEVADVSLAVLNGTDAVMLSGETAIGQHPVEAVRYLDRITREAEQRSHLMDYRWKMKAGDEESVPDAVVYAACGAAVKVKASAIIACTETGTSARLTSKYRPLQPLYGASSRDVTLRRMCLYWGVIPISCTPTDTHHDELLTALEVVQSREKLPDGSKAVITGGLSVRTPGATSVLEIREMNGSKK